MPSEDTQLEAGSGELSTSRTRRGTFVYFPFDGVIGACLNIYGEWAEHEIAFLSQFIKPGCTVVDAGANIGTLTAAFSKLAGASGRVVAVEASPEVSNVLQRNVESNGWRNVEIVKAALGDSNGEVFVPRIPPGEWSNVGGLTISETEGDSMLRTPMMTLEAIELSSLALLKLDVEGAEARVLASSMSMIERLRPVIACELNLLDQGLEIIRILSPFHYTPYFASFESYNPNNFNMAENALGFAREASLVFVPPDHPVPRQTAGTNLQTFASFEELSRLLLEMPRYGDKTDHDRVAHRLVEDREQTASKVSDMEDEKRRLEETVAELSERLNILQIASEKRIV